MQIDIGFGDVVTPKPSEIKYPTILDFPAPHLQGYNFETVIAEKFEAMIKLGSLNSRMKDFYDIWLTTRQFEFDIKKLAAAIKATFRHRKTELPSGKPIFPAEIHDEKSAQATMWKAFLKKGELKNTPATLNAVATAIEEFLSKPITIAGSD